MEIVDWLGDDVRTLASLRATSRRLCAAATAALLRAQGERLQLRLAELAADEPSPAVGPLVVAAAARLREVAASVSDKGRAARVAAGAPGLSDDQRDTLLRAVASFGPEFATLSLVRDQVRRIASDSAVAAAAAAAPRYSFHDSLPDYDLDDPDNYDFNSRRRRLRSTRAEYRDDTGIGPLAPLAGSLGPPPPGAIFPEPGDYYRDRMPLGSLGPTGPFGPPGPLLGGGGGFGGPPFAPPGQPRRDLRPRGDPMAPFGDPMAPYGEPFDRNRHEFI